MDKEKNNEMINQLENFINEFNELNNAGIFEKDPMFTETLDKIHNLESKEEKDTNSNEN